MMKKFLAATSIVAAVAMSAPAFAQDSDSSASVRATGSLTATQLTCVKTAVDVHQSAVVAAHTKFNTAVMNALATRRTSLTAAFTISSNQDRLVAIRASVQAYSNAVKAARATLKTELNAAWSVMVKAHADCKVTIGDGTTVNVRGEGKVRSEAKSDNGRHLGQLKKLLKQDTDVRADVKSEGRFKFGF